MRICDGEVFDYIPATEGEGGCIVGKAEGIPLEDVMVITPPPGYHYRPFLVYEHEAGRGSHFILTEIDNFRDSADTTADKEED